MSFQRAADFTPDHLALVKQTCLYVLPALREFDDDLTIIGGVVPSLLIGDELPPGVPPHVGTVDLDLSLALALGNAKRYRQITAQLQSLKFEPDRAGAIPDGTRWRYDGPLGKQAVIDLLPLVPKGADAEFQDVPTLRASLAAQLPLAAQDRRRITIRGNSFVGAPAAVDAWVCGPGAFIIIKALTWNDRARLPKDAYDLFYVLRNFGGGIDEVIISVAHLMGTAESKHAMQVLEDYFLDENEAGPIAVATFLFGKTEPQTQADVVGYVHKLLVGCGATWL